MSNKERLCQKLLQLNENGLYPFHMPGHKRNTGLLEAVLSDLNGEESFADRLRGAYSIDITEIDEFDNLHDAENLIKDAENAAAKLFRSEETHFLVNGSSCGILSAVAGVCSKDIKNQKIIVARNCHISVYNAIELNGLTPVYVYPKVIAESEICGGLTGSIKASDIEKVILDNQDACAVLITSPTYDGIISDVAGIARVAHEFGIPLIVDEAHGALFFMEGRSAVEYGADIVINSVHKTLPAMTQTALIHLNGNIISKEAIRKYLRIYQTSSPSYVLMGSIDYAVWILEEKGKALYRDFCVRTYRLKEALSALKAIHYISKDELILNEAFDFDESKVLISSGSSGLSGKDIYNLLREKYKLQPEMAAGDYVLLMTTIADTDEGINRLIEALINIDETCLNKNREKEADSILLKSKERNDNAENTAFPGREYQALEIIKQKIGTKSETTIYAYPPGIPIVVCGEELTHDIYHKIKDAVDKKLTVKGLL